MRDRDICWRDSTIIHSKKLKQVIVEQVQKKPVKFNIKVEAIKAKLQLKNIAREGKNRLISNYVARMTSLIG